MFFINTLFFISTLKTKIKIKRQPHPIVLEFKFCIFPSIFLFFYQSKEYITFKERFVIGFEVHLKKCYHVWLQIIPPVYSLLFLGVVKANELDLLKEHGGDLELTEDWARHLLKSME